MREHKNKEDFYMEDTKRTGLCDIYGGVHSPLLLSGKLQRGCDIMEKNHRGTAQKTEDAG